MKRFIPALILVSAALTLFAGIAQARWSEPQDISWQRTRTWNYGLTTGYYNVSARPDTAFTTLAASKADTSVAFTLLDADIPGANNQGTVVTANDSVAFAYLVLVSDSLLAPVFKASTCAVQVNWSKGLVGASLATGAVSKAWVTVATYTCSQTDSVRTWPIPFTSIGVKAGAEASLMGKDLIQRNWQFAPAVRVIVTGGSSAAVPACRMRLIKYRAPGSAAGGATTNW